MTRIYTRSGDNGSTGLANGQRVAKTSARIEAIGTIDECNSHIGMLISLVRDHNPDHNPDHDLNAQLSLIQHQLFDLGAMLAGSPKPLIQARHVKTLEKWIDERELALVPLQQFILPGGNTAAAQAHITRAVCRRAERCTLKIVDVQTNRTSSRAPNETSNTSSNQTLSRTSNQTLSKETPPEAVPTALLAFLNRLSDYLFVAARTLSARPAEHAPSPDIEESNSGETPWLPEHKRKP